IQVNLSPCSSQACREVRRLLTAFQERFTTTASELSAAHAQLSELQAVLSAKCRLDESDAPQALSGPLEALGEATTASSGPFVAASDSSDHIPNKAVAIIGITHGHIQSTLISQLRVTLVQLFEVVGINDCEASTCRRALSLLDQLEAWVATRLARAEANESQLRTRLVQLQTSRVFGQTVSQHVVG
ncbi:unnamed protein product, partial [Protopolystoma xenopodis]